MLFFDPGELGRTRDGKTGAVTSAALMLRERICVYAQLIAGYIGEFDEIGKEGSDHESVSMNTKIGVTNLSSATLARSSGLWGQSVGSHGPTVQIQPF